MNTKNNNPKKLVIKAFKEKPRLPSNYEAETMARLEGAVRAVHVGAPVGESLEGLYKAVESLCQHKLAERVYSRLETICELHVEQSVATLHERGDPDAVVFLGQVRQCWEKLCEQMLELRAIFLYLDRTYVIQNQANGVRGLWELGLMLVKKYIFALPELKHRIVMSLVTMIRSERSGENVDRSLVKTLLRMLSSLENYYADFEIAFLEDTSSFYETEGERFMEQSEVSGYMQHCERRLAQENARCVEYLEASTKRALMATVESELLSRHVDALLTKGFADLMDNVRIEDLTRMYRLFERVQALDALKRELCEYIKLRGKGIVMDEENDKDLVNRLLEFKLKLDSVLAQSFSGNEQFSQALKESFEHFINLRQNKPAELIAKFLDSKLRSGNKSGSEEEMENLLDRVLLLFRYIQGKDVFEAFYKKDLAKRLILGKYASIDAEKSMVSKLKTECGSQFTNRLEGMFKDIELSRDIMASFKQSAQCKSKIAAGMEITVWVLTSGFWPTYDQSPINLPPILLSYQEVFKEFYLSKHKNRRLAWKNSLGQCVLKANFKKQAKELNVSQYQACILLLFNEADELTYTQVKEQSGIDDDKELERTLQSLACGKVRVLQKIPKGRDVSPTDSFRFNADFSHALYRIKINTIQMRESAEENQQTTEKVFQDRQYQIDACIVRIMKTRKTLGHQLLIGELLAQLKFKIKASDLKKRIESLIDREYLERDSANQAYNYLA